MIIAATGHRPHKLGGYDAKTRLALGAFALNHLNLLRPDKVISGMALGWDQAVAGAAIALGIPLIAAIPFDGHENRWPQPSQERYRYLLSLAEKVHKVSFGYSSRAMQLRDEWMVDNADEMLALWDGSFSGTFNTLRYASKMNVPSTNLWDDWVREIGQTEAPEDKGVGDDDIALVKWLETCAFVV